MYAQRMNALLATLLVALLASGPAWSFGKRCRRVYSCPPYQQVGCESTAPTTSMEPMRRPDPPMVQLLPHPEFTVPDSDFSPPLLPETAP